MAEAPNSIHISTKLERIAKLAKDAPDMALRTLAHHIDTDWLHCNGEPICTYTESHDDSDASDLHRTGSGQCPGRSLPSVPHPCSCGGSPHG